MTNSRIAAAAFAAGALWHITSCVRAIVDPYETGSAAFERANNLGSVAHLLWLGGLLTLAALNWRSSRLLSRLGYGVGALGLAMLSGAELVIGASRDVSEVLFTASVPINAVGLICLGLGARHVPYLICGGYVVLIMAPVFAVFGPPNYWALIGWGVTWLVIAGAQLAASSPPRAVPTPITPTT